MLGLVIDEEPMSLHLTIADVINRSTNHMQSVRLSR